MTAAAPGLALAAGDARVLLAPATGGAIASFTLGKHAVLRPTPPEARAAGIVGAHACFPLVPYSNRIAGATLRFGARVHPLAPNFGDSPNSIHGIGWQREWAVAAAGAADATLMLRHDPAKDGGGAWPFAFRARQAFSLDGSARDASLVATLSIENTGDAAFPCGLGFHPFFPRTAATTLGFRARGVYDNDAMQLPVGHATVDAARRFDPPRPVHDLTLDHVFSGWDGRATIAQPDAGLVVDLSAPPPASFLVAFVPPKQDFLAVEPVTHMTDAFNHAARGEPGTGALVLDRAPRFLVRCASTSARAHDPAGANPNDLQRLPLPLRARRPREPRRMSGVVGGRAGALLGRHQRPVAQPLRSRHRPQRRDADAGVDRLLRAAPGAAASSSRCATASGSPATTARWERTIAGAPYDPAHHRFNDGRCDPQGRFLAGTMNERRDADSAGLWRLDADLSLPPGPRRHDDQQRPRVESRRTDDVSRRHAEARRARLRLRCRDRHAVAAPDVRAMDRRVRPAGRRGGRRDGCYWTAFYRGGKVLRIAPNGRHARRVPGSRDVPDDVRVRRPRPADALRDHGAAAARRRGTRPAAAVGRHLRDAVDVPGLPEPAFAG